MKIFNKVLTLFALFLSTSVFALVNINTASVEELETLNGIGKAKAQAIIKYREENGNFIKKEDILNVKGIGKAVFEKIADEITIEVGNKAKLQDKKEEKVENAEEKKEVPEKKEESKKDNKEKSKK